MSLKRCVAVAFLTVTTACGSDLVAPAAADPIALDGVWFYSANSLTSSVFGEAVDCTYQMEMQLTARGAVFDGIYNNALMVCTLFGDMQLVDAGGGNIVDGSRVGVDVEFSVDTESIRNVGTLGQSGMFGTVEIQLVVQRDALIDTILVTGPWSASR